MFELEYEFIEKTFVYEVEPQEMFHAIEKLGIENDCEKDIKTVINDYEDELKEWFYDDAKQAFDDSLTDPYILYGVSRQDFY